MFEKLHQPLATRLKFYQRLLRGVMVGVLLIGASELMGMLVLSLLLLCIGFFMPFIKPKKPS